MPDKNNIDIDDLNDGDVVLEGKDKEVVVQQKDDNGSGSIDSSSDSSSNSNGSPTPLLKIIPCVVLVGYTFHYLNLWIDPHIGAVSEPPNLLSHFIGFGWYTTGALLILFLWLTPLEYLYRLLTPYAVGSMLIALSGEIPGFIGKTGLPKSIGLAVLHTLAVGGITGWIGFRKLNDIYERTDEKLDKEIKPEDIRVMHSSATDDRLWTRKTSDLYEEMSDFLSSDLPSEESTYHDRAAELLRELTQSYPPQDGNKAVALHAVGFHYLLHGEHLDIDADIIPLLERLDSDNTVDDDEIQDYFKSNLEEYEEGSTFSETQTRVDERRDRPVSKMDKRAKLRLLYREHHHDLFEELNSK